jgi:succinate dehydrogenase / fumarate reductase cytochrome b subunit
MTTDTTRSTGRRGLRGWLVHPGSGTPTWAFLANRVSALILVGYLYLHLVVLSMLVRGSDSWDSFLAVAGTRAFVAVDLVLFAAIVWHAANGVRLALVGTGIAVRRQRALLVGVVVVSVLVVGVAAVALLAKG